MEARERERERERERVQYLMRSILVDSFENIEFFAMRDTNREGKKSQIMINCNERRKISNFFPFFSESTLAVRRYLHIGDGKTYL